DRLAVLRGRILQRLRARERADRHSMLREVFQPALDDGLRVGATLGEEELDELFDELALERLEPARAEARALERDAAPLVEQRVRLHLVAEHRREASVELERDARGERAGERVEQRLVVLAAMR